MRLTSGHTLAYCTNVHRGDGWTETFSNLRNHALAVRDQVAPQKPYALGLRLSDSAARELQVGDNLKDFRNWLERENCFINGINGFPMGTFHGQPVKEKVFAPDWSQPERREYTQRLFDLLVILKKPNELGTVSTLPGSFKAFGLSTEGRLAVIENILKCGQYLQQLRDRTGQTLRLALEPEPLGLFENTAETIQFFEQLRKYETSAGLVDDFIGVCYDTCHFALQYEDAQDSIKKLNEGGAPIFKYHLSSALRLRPTPVALDELSQMQEPVYLHQCISRTANGSFARFQDIPVALAHREDLMSMEELRVHFHVPLQCEKLSDHLSSTSDYLQKVLDVVCKPSRICSEWEIETYTWEVLPQKFQSTDVNEQIVNEYQWTLQELNRRGIRPLS